MKGEKVARVSRKVMVEKREQELAALEAQKHAAAHMTAGISIGGTTNGSPTSTSVASAGVVTGVTGMSAATTGNGSLASLTPPSVSYASPAAAPAAHSAHRHLWLLVPAPLLLPLALLLSAQLPAQLQMPQMNLHTSYPHIGVGGAWLSTSHVSHAAPESTTYYDHTDLSLLAADLNNLVSDMMVEVNGDMPEIASTESNLTPPTPTSDTAMASNESQDVIQRNIGLGFIEVRNPEERFYLNEFYQEFCNVILPFNAYDRTLQTYYNPVRDIVLKYALQEPFLLAAIMAQGARSLHQRNGVQRDEEAYYKYLLRCLKHLGPALGDASNRTGPVLLANIELVLLTVLLLTLSNAANAKQNWRPHLKGAKDLLLKHTVNSNGAQRTSKIVVFCKYWFILFEILAGLGSRLGGTVQNEDELNLLLTCRDPYEYQVLTELGLVLPNGFNLLGGYHHLSIEPLRDLIKLLNKLRVDKSYRCDESAEYVRLLAEFHRQQEFVFFNRKCILDQGDFPSGYTPSGLLLDPITVNSRCVIISWMDTSQQLYSLAATITILTDCFKLAYDLPQIQDLTCKLTSLLRFLSRTPETPLLIQCSIMMIQWPMMVAGLNLHRDSDKFLVTRFFESAATIGAGSAGHSMNRLKRVWQAHDGGLHSDTTDDTVDVVQY